MPDVGEFILFELASDLEGAVFAPGHYECHSVAIKAGRNGKDVIGHAHLYPDSTAASNGHIRHAAYLQYRWVLAQLADPTNELTDIQIALDINDRWLGFPDGMSQKRLEAMAKKLGIKVIASIVSHEPDIERSETDILTTREYSVLRKRDEGSRFLFIPRYWKGEGA